MSETRKVGKYEILEELGRGGFATVYKARDLELNRLVALKVLHPYWRENIGFTTRFHREARRAASLQHPNIVTIYEAGEIESQPFIAMEYIQGQTLQAILEAKTAFSTEQLLVILEQIARALDYAHSQGVIHRDVKPANIMVQRGENGVHVFLLDFGLLKMTEGSVALTSAGTLLGSPEYMAPEQANPDRTTEVGPPADRYAFGIVAYHMLTGRVPFRGNSPGTLKAHEHDPVPPPKSFRPDLPEAVAKALLKMLAKTPADRFNSASAFVAELKRAITQEKQLAPLYRQLQASIVAKDWRSVVVLGGRIQAVDPNYRDVSQLARKASARIRRKRLLLGCGLLTVLSLGGLLLVFLVFIYPSLPCNDGIITYVTQSENGKSLWLIDAQDKNHLLLEGVADVMVLAIAPNRCHLALAVSEEGELKRDFNDFPRFMGSNELTEEDPILATDRQQQPVSLLLISDDGQQRTIVVSDVLDVDASFTADGRLLVAILEESEELITVSYYIQEMDGSQRKFLYSSESEPVRLSEEVVVTAVPVEVTRVIIEEVIDPDTVEVTRVNTEEVIITATPE